MWRIFDGNSSKHWTTQYAEVSARECRRAREGPYLVTDMKERHKCPAWRRMSLLTHTDSETPSSQRPTLVQLLPATYSL